MCPHCRAFITIKDKVCPYCGEAVAPRKFLPEGADLIAGIIPSMRFTTTLILLINFGLYIAASLYFMQHSDSESFWSLDTRTLVIFGAKWNPGLVHGQWWRLVTAGFMHVNVVHILMNSWVLFDLGTQVEEAYGTGRMLTIYFMATVLGFYASACWSPAVSAGASAGLFGFIGAMIALGVMHRSPMGAAIRGMYLRWAAYGLVFGMVSGFADNAAHLGGLAAGFGVAYLAGTPRLVAGVWDTFWRLAGWVCIGLTAFSFLKMYLWFAANPLR
jgi:rhomboid protease GluP